MPLPEPAAGTKQVGMHTQMIRSLPYDVIVIKVSLQVYSEQGWW